MISTSRNWWRTSLWIAIFIYFILTLIISFSYHWGYMSSLTDLGTFDQAVWGTLHDYFFLNTIAFNKAINYLGFHFRPILLIFLPFYILLPKIEWMILAQSSALSLTAWPIYLLAKRVTKSDSSALFWALAYLVNPFIIGMPPWVFRPESLAVPFIAIALLSVEKSNFRLLLLSCFVIVLCKEHFGVTVIGFGILWGLKNKRWKQAVLLILFGTMYSVLILGVVMPSLSPTGKHVMLSKGLGQLSRYGWLGHSIKEVFQTLLFYPIHVVKTVLLKMNGANYLLELLIPFLLFPLAAPGFLLPGLADLMVNMLSANPWQRTPFAYHSACLVPVLLVAGIYGTKKIYLYVKKISLTQLAGFVVVACFISGYYFAPLPLPGARDVWAPINFLNWPDPTLPKIRYAIDSLSSVSAQHNVGAHFSQRREIYCYPNNVGKVQVIILRLEIPTTSSEALHQHLGMELPDYLTSIERLLSGKEYGVLLWNDPWLLFERGLADYRHHDQIENKIHQMRKEWQINPT